MHTCKAVSIQKYRNFSCICQIGMIQRRLAWRSHRDDVPPKKREMTLKALCCGKAVNSYV